MGPEGLDFEKEYATGGGGAAAGLHSAESSWAAVLVGGVHSRPMRVCVRVVLTPAPAGVGEGDLSSTCHFCASRVRQLVCSSGGGRRRVGDGGRSRCRVR